LLHTLLPVIVHSQAPAQPWRWGEQAAKKAKGSVTVDNSKSIFVRNLPFAASEEDLDAFFSKAGQVVRRPLKVHTSGMLADRSWIRDST
jgi:RNA recognition motif-containing protein